MSMTVEAAPSRAFSSSSVTGTYWALATSYPLTSSPRSTTACSTGQYVCWRIRWPHVAWSRWKATPAEAAAVYSLIGMDTSPNEIIPEPIECDGMPPYPPCLEVRTLFERYPGSSDASTDRLPMERAHGQ